MSTRKYKISLAIITLCLLSGCGSWSAIASQTVRIDDNGSGTVIGVRPAGDVEVVRILTANHVPQHEYPIVVLGKYDAWGFRRAASACLGAVTHRDTANDLAIITLIAPRGAARAAPVARWISTLGARLYVSAKPGGLQIVNQGRMGGWRNEKGIYTGQAAPGSSGGGVYNAWGELCGVVTEIAVGGITGGKVYLCAVYRPVTQKMIAGMTE